jgi:Predicted permeases
MLSTFLDALKDSAEMIPFLLIIYIGIEFLEYKLDDNLIERVKNSGKIAPALGSAFGLIPQCGFSVMATALYTKRVITAGTLLAVYLSTSDEALPIILSNPSKSSVIVPLLSVKFVIAIIAGYSIDFFMTKKISSETEICATTENTSSAHLSEENCCNHGCNHKKFTLKNLVVNPLIHTTKIFSFVFIITLIINLIIFKVGENNLGHIFLRNSIFQPILSAFIGLIPNCGASVAITEIFLKGGLSFGSAISGLCAGAGLGIIVLFRENKNMKDCFKIIGLLLFISSLAGILIQTIYG